MTVIDKLTNTKSSTMCYVLCILFSFSLTLAEGTGEKLGKSVDEKVEDVKSYSSDKKEKIQKEFQVQIDKIDRDIQALKNKIADTKKNASYEVKSHWNDNISFLEKRKMELSQDLESLKQSSGNAWDELKTGMQNAVADLKTSFKKAKSEFSHSEGKTSLEKNTGKEDESKHIEKKENMKSSGQEQSKKSHNSKVQSHE